VIKEEEPMLSDQFVKSLDKDGFLNPLLERVKNDPDLDLQIRNKYINIYYKGNNLLKLTQNYSMSIHNTFKVDYLPHKLNNSEHCASFIDALPKIKEKIVNNYTKAKSFETEYEQLLIRANSYTKKVNSEYFVIDRHYAKNKINIIDIVGIFSDRNHRNHKTIKIYPFIGEIKYSLNPDIKKLDDQIRRYYEEIKKTYQDTIERIEEILHLKSRLGLLEASDNLIEKFKTAEVNNDIKKLRIVIIFIDYNPYSKSHNEVIMRLKELDISDQIYIFHTGLSMWQENVKEYKRWAR
jgi:hypothetical protein